jgi:FkbM family methyltransferase
MINKQEFEQKVWLIKFVKNWREVLNAINRTAENKPPLILKNGYTIHVQHEDRNYKGTVLLALRLIFVEKMFVQDNFYRPKSNDIIIDIGSNIGLFPIFCCSQTEEKITIHCFEPEPTNIKFLARNIRENRLDSSVKIYPYAIWKTEEQKDLWSHPITYSYHNPSFFRNFITTTGENPILRGTVDCITLDKCLEITQAKKVDFLKIHCEGAEIEILSSASAKTLQKIKKIAIVSHEHLRSNCARIVQEILSERNFATKICPIDNHDPIIHAWNLNYC